MPDVGTEGSSGTLDLSRRESILLASITLAALLLRLLWLQFEHAITSDGFYYATLGARLASGDLQHGLSVYWPPLYPALVGVASWFFEDLELAGRMVSVLLGTAVVIAGYFLCRAVMDRRVALVCAALLMFQPQLLMGSAEVLSDASFTLFFVGAVFFGMVALFEGSRSAFFATGLALGASYLTRPEAFGFFGLFLVLSLATPHPGKWSSVKRTWAGPVLLLVGFTLLTLPYLSYLRYETGRWTISAKLDAHLLSGSFDWRDLMPDGKFTYADRFYADVRPTADPVPIQSERSGHRDFDLVGRGLWMAGELGREYLEIVPKVFPPLVLILAGIGLFAGGRETKRTLQELYLLCFIVAALLGYAIIFSIPRYLMPLIPLVYVWVASGVVEVARRLESLIPTSPRLRSAVAPLVMVLLALSMTKEITYSFRQGKREDAYEMKMAGLWIKERGTESPVLLANSPVVAFYANARHCFYTPNVTLERVIEHAERLQVDYVIVDERKVRERSLEQLKPLLQDEASVPGLKLVYRFEEEPGLGVLVYELSR